MARLRYNGLTATLGADLLTAGTTITFASALTHAGGTAVPTIGAGDYIPLAILDATTNGLLEIVHLTAYTSGATTGTVTRAQEGTSAADQPSGSTVVNGPTAADFTGATTTARLEPTAPLVDYTPDSTIINVAAGATHAAFPFTCTLRSGKHLVQYRAATDHDWVSDAAVKLKSSTDDGATWSAAWTMVDNAGEDDNGGGLVQLRDGTVVGLIVRRPTTTQTGWYTQALTSADEGATWGTPVTLNAGASGFEYATHVIVLDNGDVLAFLYCNDGGDDYVVVMASTDSGTTWATRGSIVGGAGEDYQEPQAVVMPDGELLVFMRYASGTTGEIRMARSVDNGATWTTPTAILTQAGGQPAPYLTPNGVLVVAYRDLSTADLKTLWASSKDNGNTWTARGNFTGSTEVYVYAGWLNLSDGDIMCVYALESLDADHIGDTYAMRFDREVVGAATGGGGGVTTSWINAGEMRPTLDSPTLTAYNGELVTYNLSASSAQAIVGTAPVPSDWSTFDIDILWLATTTDTGNAYLDGGIGWVEPGTTFSATYLAAGVSAAPGIAGRVVSHRLASDVAVAGTAAAIRVIRAATDAADTFGSDACIIGVLLTKVT